MCWRTFHFSFQEKLSEYSELRHIDEQCEQVGGNVSTRGVISKFETKFFDFKIFSYIYLTFKKFT